MKPMRVYSIVNGHRKRLKSARPLPGDRGEPQAQPSEPVRWLDGKFQRPPLHEQSRFEFQVATFKPGESLLITVVLLLSKSRISQD
jgi:hypothetical protein